MSSVDHEISNVANGIKSIYSNSEEEISYGKLKVINDFIDKIIDKITKDNNSKSGLSRAIKIKKFVVYRMMKMELRRISTNDDKEIKKDLYKHILNSLCPKYEGSDSVEGYEDLITIISEYRFVDKKDFIDVYKNKLWEISWGIITANISDENRDKLKGYLEHINDEIYGSKYEQLRYTKGYDLNNTSITYNDIVNTKYNSLIKTVKREIDFNNLSDFASAEHKLLSDVKGTNKENIFSFLFNNDFRYMGLVNKYTDELYRIYFNAIYSYLIKVDINDDMFIISKDKMGFSYDKLRLLVYLRNSSFNLKKFISKIDITSKKDNIDYSILEVIPIFSRFVKNYELIDKLILIHKYTVELWKNGSKHLYFYTLHNQEHAVVLIKNIVLLTKLLDCLNVSDYDYFLLFASAYLHDVSMTNCGNDELFLNDVKSDYIVSDFIKNTRNTNDYLLKNELLESSKKISAYYESKIRSSHAYDSAEYIIYDDNLYFIDDATRKNIADISKAHGMNCEDVYRLRSNATEKLHIKNDKILLRMADLLDINAFRVSELLLKKNLANMPKESAFHWISHLLTPSFDVKANFECSKHGNEINEEIIIDIVVLLNNYSSEKSRGCKNCKLVSTESDDIIKIEILSGNDKESENNNCDCSSCNIICKWFVRKNQYLINELSELLEYMQYLMTDSIFNINIKVNLNVDRSKSVNAEYLNIIKSKI